MQLEPLTGARKPEETDGPLGGLQISNAVTDLAPLVLHRFPTVSARDAAWSSWSSANSGAGIPDGASCWCDVPGAFYDRIGGSWEQRTDLELIGTNGPISGTLPSPYLPKFQAGTASLTTNGSAVGQFAWPTPFPGGVLAVALTSLTDGVPMLRVVGGGGTTKTTCEFVARNYNGSGAAGVVVTVSFIGIGW